MFSKIRKGIKKFMDDRINKCEEILSSAQNRLIVGLIFLGIGAGFVLSAYIKVPN